MTRMGVMQLPWALADRVHSQFCKYHLGRELTQLRAPVAVAPAGANRTKQQGQPRVSLLCHDGYTCRANRTVALATGSKSGGYTGVAELEPGSRRAFNVLRLAEPHEKRGVDALPTRSTPVR